jgi:hypothetical protein
MDTFKIIVIIFLMILTYQIYQLNCTVYKDNFEGFEGAQQSVGGVDDTNAINTLAQIAKNLMAGGVTVPGNMRVQGDISTGEGKVSINNGTINLQSDGGGGLYFVKRGNPGKVEEWNRLHTGDVTVNGGLRVNGNLSPAHSVWHKSTDGIDRIHYGNGTHSYYKTGDSHFFRNRADKDVVAIDGDGVLYAQGRNILAELNDLRAHSVRIDRQYYIDIGVRANGDGCCGNGKGLIIHGGGDSNAAGWGDKNVTTRFNFRQV